MRYLSVCSGIEAATVAWKPLGMEAVAFAEIEKFPCNLLKHYYPSVPNWGDMNDFASWPDADVDVLVGGTPCQSFSVAGLRAGLADPRGNLALVYLAIAARYRPEWLVWENVPGVLSLDEGRAFGSILGGMVELGYGFAYRVLDAQYHRVAQRRRRVFVVGHLGDWRRAAEVLFEPASLRGDSPPSREAGQVAPTVPSRSSAGGGLGTDFDCDGGLVTGIPEVVGALSDGAHCGGGLNGQDAYTGRIIPAVSHALRGEGFDASEDGTGRGTPLVTAYMADDYSNGSFEEVDSARPLTTSADRTRAAPIVAFKESQSGIREGDVHATLDANKGSRRVEGIRQGMAVRRLTPLECERLQGFPDGYTDIPGASDSARYKALGNSMAVPVMRWIGKRLLPHRD